MSKKKESVEFKDGFDFDGDVAWKGAHADGATRANAVFGSKHVGEKFGAAVDHGRMFAEVWSAIDHAEDFNDAFDAGEPAELFAQGGENGEAGLARSRFSGSEVEVRPDAADDK